MENKLENELNSIIKSGIPKAVYIQGKRVYISKKIISKLKKENESHSGGILPLAALIPIIMSIVGGTAGAAGGIAGVVQSVKSSQKDDAQKKLADEQLKQLKEKDTSVSLSKSGSPLLGKAVKAVKVKPVDGAEKAASGLYLDPYQGSGQSLSLTSEQGSGISDYLKNILKNSNIEEPEKRDFKNSIKKFKNGIKIERTGSGLFLKNY